MPKSPTAAVFYPPPKARLQKQHAFPCMCLVPTVGSPCPTLSCTTPEQHVSPCPVVRISSCPMLADQFSPAQPCPHQIVGVDICNCLQVGSKNVEACPAKDLLEAKRTSSCHLVATRQFEALTLWDATGTSTIQPKSRELRLPYRTAVGPTGPVLRHNCPSFDLVVDFHLGQRFHSPIGNS